MVAQDPYVSCSFVSGSFALTDGLAHRTQSSNLKSGQVPQSYGSFPPNHDTPNGSSDALPDASPPAAPGLDHDGPPGSVLRRTRKVFQKRTTIGLVICLAIIILQSVLTVWTLARYINLDSAAHRALKEKSALVVERKKSERERQMWEWERGGWEVDKGKWEQERGKWEQERGEWEWEKGEWEREKGEWESEREKLELEKEKLRLERERWERVREDRVPQGAFWEVVSPAVACSAYGKREYWGMLQNVPEGWTAMDACTNMPVEIVDVTIRRPDRCASVEGSPHIHGYWMVDWDQPDCKPWYKDFHDAVSPPPLSVLYGYAHTSQGCTSYASGQRRIEAHLVGIIDSKEQDWWLMCSTTPLTWNQTTYMSPTHCESRVSSFPLESFTGEADPCPR